MVSVCLPPPMRTEILISFRHSCVPSSVFPLGECRNQGTGETAESWPTCPLRPHPVLTPHVQTYSPRPLDRAPFLSVLRDHPRSRPQLQLGRWLAPLCQEGDFRGCCCCPFASGGLILPPPHQAGGNETSDGFLSTLCCTLPPIVSLNPHDKCVRSPSPDSLPGWTLSQYTLGSENLPGTPSVRGGQGLEPRQSDPEPTTRQHCISQA